VSITAHWVGEEAILHEHMRNSAFLHTLPFDMDYMLRINEAAGQQTKCNLVLRPLLTPPPVVLSNIISNSTAMILLSNLRNKIIRSLREEACSDIEIIFARETSTSTDAATVSRKSSCNAGENSSTLNSVFSIHDIPSVILITTDTEVAL